MKLDTFSKLSTLLEQPEIEKVRLLAYYYQKTESLREFGMADVRRWFNQLSLHEPNFSRLKERIEKSKSFVRGSAAGLWKLHAVDLDELQSLYPGVASDSEDVESTDCVLPHPIYDGTRGFIELLAKQINASYEYNIFDGCSVLMRRLVEVLLILSYEHLGIEGTIQDASGLYLPLERIVADAKSNTSLRLSRDSKSMLDELRTLGNFSAHKIYFNCRRADLQRVIGNYRATVEELLYKSGIRK